MVSRSFQLYKISGKLREMRTENFDNITKKIDDFGLKNEEPNRYGFDFVKWRGDYIYGVFAQEFKQTNIEYDDENKREQLDTTPFEYYIFIIILNDNEGIIALEQKRITGQQGLMAKTRQNFENTLSEILKPNIPYFIGFEPYIYQLTRDEIINYFNENKIIAIKVKELKNKKVPDSLKFFNPRYDLDKLNKSWWDDDFKYIEEEHIRGENLQETKAGKAAVYTGEPKSLTLIDKTGVKTVQSEIGPVDKLPIENYDSKEKLNVERAVEFLKNKMWKMTHDEYQRKLEDF